MSPVLAHLPAAPPAAAPSSTAVVQHRNPAPHGWALYTVRSGDTVRDLAVHTHSTEQAIVSKNRLPGTGGRIHIGQRLWLPRTSAPAPRARPAAPAASAAYRVAPGDTLGGIALRRGVSLAALLKLNRLSTRATIYPGQVLRVPAAARRATRPAAVPTRTYTVRSGDTLGHIAGATHTPLPTLLSLNRLSARSLIHPGQRLRVKGTAAPAGPSAASKGKGVYTVRSGDTLGAIALRHHTTMAALLKLNRLANANRLSVGTRLWVPTAAPAFSATTFAGRTYPSATINAANANRARLARARVPGRTQTRAIIVSTARRHGVDPALALAVAWQESGWNQRQVSVANAIGAMQVIPSSGVWASEMAGRRLDLLNTHDNITAGVVILRSLSRSARTPDEAIAGYYQGLGSVQRHGMYPDTKQYVAAIRSHRARM